MDITEAEMAEGRDSIVADDNTIRLILSLRKQGGVAKDGAALIEFLIDTRSDIVEALQQERERSDEIERQANESAAVLSRLYDHLGTLQAFTIGRPSDDPWPEPEPPKKRRSRK